MHFVMHTIYLVTCFAHHQYRIYQVSKLHALFVLMHGFIKIVNEHEDRSCMYDCKFVHYT